jgi:hypothetical protein
MTLVTFSRFALPAGRRFRTAIDAFLGILMLRHDPLDVRLAGSGHCAQNGQHVSVNLIALCANISKIKFWKCF